MTKQRLLLLLSIGLFVINIGLLLFLTIDRRPEGPRRMHQAGPAMDLVGRLDFDKDQRESFTKLIDKHSMQIDKIDSRISETKRSLYENLSSANADSAKDELIAQLGALQQEIEKEHYNHFLELRAICKGDQIERFNLLAKDLVIIFKGRRGPGKGQGPRGPRPQ